MKKKYYRYIAAVITAAGIIGGGLLPAYASNITLSEDSIAWDNAVNSISENIMPSLRAGNDSQKGERLSFGVSENAVPLATESSMVSDNSTVSNNGTVSDNKTISDNSTASENKTVSDNSTASENSEKAQEEKPFQEGEAVSGNKETGNLSSNTASGNSDAMSWSDGERPTLSDTVGPDEEMKELMPSVILPSSLPFTMVLFGEGYKGQLTSDEFEISNQGNEKVRIHLEAVANTPNAEEYVMSEESVKEKTTEGKKSAYFYMEINTPQGVIQLPVKAGEASEAAEFVLEPAKEGSSDSKASFVLGGDLRSDMEAPWQEGELGITITVNFTIIHDEQG